MQVGDSEVQRSNSGHCSVKPLAQWTWNMCMCIFALCMYIH